MDKQNLRPQPAQPVHRTTIGQLPPELAELSEEALQLQGDAFSASSVSVLSSQHACGSCNIMCSYDGDDGE